MSRFVFDPGSGLVVPRERRVEPYRGKRLCSLVAGMGPAFFGSAGGLPTETNPGVLLMLHGTGSPALDSSSYARTPNVFGTVTSVGGKQVLAAASTLQWTHSSAFYFTGVFAIEGLFTWSSLPASGVGWPWMRLWNGSSDTTGRVLFQVGNDTANLSPQNKVINFNRFGDTSFPAFGGALVAGVQYFIRIQRDASNVIRVWVNEVCVASYSYSGAFGGGSGASAFEIFGPPTGSGATLTVTELRVSNYERATGTITNSSIYDPFIADRLLLAQCEGANGSTTITDSSPIGRTPYAVGGNTIATAQAKFGSASLLCNGVTNWKSSDFAIASDAPFCAEYYLRFVGSFGIYIPFYDPSIGDSSPRVSFYASGGNFTLSRAGFGDTSVVSMATLFPSLNTWYHLILQRRKVASSASSIEIFVNRVLKASTGYTGALGNGAGGFAAYCDGYVDDIRFSRIPYGNTDEPDWTVGYGTSSGGSYADFVFPVSP